MPQGRFMKKKPIGMTKIGNGGKTIIPGLFLRKNMHFQQNDKLLDYAEKTVVALIGIIIFFNPFPHTTSVKEIAYYLALAISIFLLVRDKKEMTFQSPLFLPFGLFTIWVLITLPFSVDVKNSLHDVCAHLFKYIILYCIIIKHINSKVRIKIVSNLFILSSTLLAVGGIIYYYFIENHPFSSRLGVGSFVQVQTNSITFIFVVAVVIILHSIINNKILWQRFTYIIAGLCILSAMFLCQTRSAMLALLLSFFIMFRKLIIFVPLSLIIVALIVATPIKSRFSKISLLSHSNNVRVSQNALTFEIIKDNPVAGIGFGIETYGKLDLKKYEQRLPEKYHGKVKFNYAHNGPLNLFVRVGLVGFGICLWILIVLSKMLIFVIRNGKSVFLKSWSWGIAAGISGIMIISLFEPTFHHINEVLICMMVAMATIIYKLNEEHDEKQRKVGQT